MPGPLRLNANSCPGSAAVTLGVLYQAGPRPPLFLALNRAPTAGPVAPLAHEQRTHSGLHSPIRVMSATSPYTVSGEASMSMVTSSWAMRLVMCCSSDFACPRQGLTPLLCNGQTHLSMTDSADSRVALRRARAEREILDAPWPEMADQGV